MKLLSTHNFKLNKSKGFNYLTAGLALAPNKQSGHNVCPHATKGCIDACNLWFSGHMVMSNVRKAMIDRTNLFFENNDQFHSLLDKEILNFYKLAKKKNVGCAIRLNTASDIYWEKIRPSIFKDYHDISFYDYTKSKARSFAQLEHHFPANYELTYSFNERSKIDDVTNMLNNGINVAFVTNIEYNKNTGYMAPIPEFFNLGKYQYFTTDGDKHDLRLRKFDGRGRAIILRFKGSNDLKNKAMKNGFCLDIKEYT